MILGQRDSFDDPRDGPVHVLNELGAALCGGKVILGHKDPRLCSCCACRAEVSLRQVDASRDWVGVETVILDELPQEQMVQTEMFVQEKGGTK